MASSLSRDDLRAIKRLLEAKATKEAGITQLASYLEQHEDDAAGWYLMGRMFSTHNHHALVALAMEQALECEPGNVDALWELLKARGLMTQHERMTTLAEMICEIDPKDPRGPLGRAVACERTGRYDDAILWGERCLELDPDNKHAKSTMGFCYLRKRDFARGWNLYHHGLGHIENRDKHTYVGEPEWDGTPGQHIAVYSEQGLGDQIAGIEPLRDFPGTVAALSVDPKLRPWFARCFPDIAYHGSDITERASDPDDPLRIDASINLFGLHKYLRRSESDYPKTPFLTPHPRKAAMWRAALDQLGTRPKIGLAWSGGVPGTFAHERTHSLYDWSSLFDYPADFVSLEYKDRDEETAAFCRKLDARIHVWPDAIRSPNYEDTAALISQLDVVVCPPTTVAHACGAMGVPAFVLVNERSNPHYCVSGDRMPYYGSVTLVRTSFEELCRHLFAYISATTNEKQRRTA